MNKCSIPDRTTTSNRNFKSKMYTIGVCALVRRLQHTVYKVVVDLVRSMVEVCAFLFIYNKVSQDFANWLKI
jgi:hypothetical protein